MRHVVLVALVVVACPQGDDESSTSSTGETTGEPVTTGGSTEGDSGSTTSGDVDTSGSAAGGSTGTNPTGGEVCDYNQPCETSRDCQSGQVCAIRFVNGKVQPASCVAPCEQQTCDLAAIGCADLLVECAPEVTSGTLMCWPA